MNTVLIDSVNEAEYSALTTGAAVQTRPNFGVLRLTNRDRVDFLQRMTTNDVARVQPGASVVTVLTSPTARVDAVFTVLCWPDELLLLPAEGQTEALRQRLQGQIFFMDKVTISDESSSLSRLRLMGPDAADVLQAADLPLPQIDDGYATDRGVTVLAQDRYDLPGFEIILAADGLGTTIDSLMSAGATVLQEEAAYEVRRVELGRPRPGKELTDAYSPLEAGLAWTCAENKGCYTGQEIIARQITYDKVTKTLVRLHSVLPLTPGADVVAGGRSVGTVTSSVVSPSQGPLALAIIKRPFNTSGTEVLVAETAARVEEI